MKIKVKLANSYDTLDRAWKAIQNAHNEGIVATQYLEESGEHELAGDFGRLTDRMADIRSEFEDKFFVKTRNRTGKLRIKVKNEMR